MGFVDMLEAFDSVPRKQIWRSLRIRGMKTKLRNNIKAICEVIINYVMKNGEQSEEIVTKSRRDLKPYFVRNDRGWCCKRSQVKNLADRCEI